MELLKSKSEVNFEYAIYHPAVVEVLALVSDKGSQHKFCSEAAENSYNRVLGVAEMKRDESAVDAKWNLSELLKVLLSQSRCVHPFNLLISYGNY